MIGTLLDEAFFARPVAQVAPELLGCVIEVGDLAGEIVEVERYQQDDPASHSFRGPTPRAAVMFGPPGRLYVYRSYGVHWCANVVCEPEGYGAAVNKSPAGMRLLLGVAPPKGQLLEIQTGHSTLGRAICLVEVCWTKPLRKDVQGALYLVGCRQNFGIMHGEAI